MEPMIRGEEKVRDQHIKIVKVEEVSLKEINSTPKEGKLIFITRKYTNEEKPAVNIREKMSKPWTLLTSKFSEFIRVS